MPRSPAGLLIMDANVLIDFCETDRTVLSLVTENIGQVHVALPILVEEVELLSDGSWRDLGIVAVEPTLELAAAAATRRGRLSFHDHLCLLLAKDNGWSCVTNDGRLRRECDSENVPVIWGLEIVAMLVDAGVLDAKSATELAHAIQKINPYITEKIIALLLERIAGPKRR